MSATLVKQVRRLAQYRPFERGGLDLREVLHDLVLAVAALNGGTVRSLFACRVAFEDVWGLEVEIDEIRPVVATLFDQQMAERVGKGFRLMPDVLADLETRANQSQATEDRALAEWVLAVRAVAPAISDEELAVLEADLRQWIHLIIARHGAEAALMLYPEDDRARRFFDEVDLRGFESLPDREPLLRRLRELALPLFIRSPSPDQRRFLAGLLNTSFYMTVLTVDASAKQLVQEQMRGHRVYLDTNFLYAVMGAASPEEVYSSRRLIQLSKDLGIEFAYTPWTKDELRTSIARSRRDIETHSRFVRPELADTMLRVSGDKGFNRLFWQTYKDQKARPKDVFDRLEHFDQDLAKYQITEIAEGCTAVNQQIERVSAYSSLLNAERWPFQKEWIVLEHDAKSRLLVERLRGAGTIRISNARFWFLTYDAKLPRFAERVPDNGDKQPELPFCISPSAWVQVIRALTPRTEDFDRTVVDLLTSPFVGYRLAVNSSVVEEVVGRMDHFEDASPETALAVLTDTARVSEIERAVSSEDDEAVELAINAAYSAKARELQETARISVERATEAERAREEALEKVRETEQERERERTEGEEALRRKAVEMEAAKHQHEHERERLASEHDALRQRLDAAEADRAREASRARQSEGRIQAMEDRLARDEAKRRRGQRVLLGTALAVIGVAIALALPLLVLTHGTADIAAVAGGVALALVGVRLLAGRERGHELVTWGSLLAAIVAILVAVAVESR